MKTKSSQVTTWSIARPAGDITRAIILSSDAMQVYRSTTLPKACPCAYIASFCSSKPLPALRQTRGRSLSLKGTISARGTVRVLQSTPATTSSSGDTTVTADTPTSDAAAGNVQHKESESEASTSSASTADSFVPKSIKWQLRNAKDFHRVLYIMRLSRHETGWHDASNISAALRKTHSLMQAALKKEEQRAAMAEPAKNVPATESNPAASSQHKGRVKGERGVRIGKKGAPPEAHARRGGTLAGFLAMTAAEVPRMRVNDMAQVETVLRSLASVGLSEDVVPALAAIEGEQHALRERQQAMKLAAEEENLARLKAMGRIPAAEPASDGDNQASC